MGLSSGIVGLPNAGKSTIFNALSSTRAEVANYPFTTIKPNLCIVSIPDGRLNKIASILSPPKVLPATIEFIDIAGLVKGASKGEGLGNQFLDNIRNVDAIIHVVRCFKDEDVAHVHGRVDPIGDIGVVNTELILSDLEVVERRLERLSGRAKSGIEEAKKEMAILESIKSGLERGMPLRLQGLSGDDIEQIRGLNLITIKPVLYIANIGEEDLSDNLQDIDLKSFVQEEERAELITICGRLESEITELDEDERQVFLKELGIEESGLERLIKGAYRLLNLITFYTIVGGKELRAWTVPDGTTAVKAAGRVHSDFERGFIRVDVMHYDDFIRAGSEARAREMGLLRSEGRDYRVTDGDLLHFHFSL